MRDKGNEDKI